MFEEDFAGSTLPFNGYCAADYALLVAARMRSGQAISAEDAQIAATALRHNLNLAAHNGKDFKDIAGLAVVNPWA
jgi:predicted nucleic acid-binding protein